MGLARTTMEDALGQATTTREHKRVETSHYESWKDKQIDLKKAINGPDYASLGQIPIEPRSLMVQ